MCKRLLFFSLILVLLPWKLFSLDPGDDNYITSLRFMVYLEQNKIDSALMLVKVEDLKKYRKELVKAHKQIIKVNKASYPNILKIDKPEGAYFVCDYLSKTKANFSNYRVYIYFTDSSSSAITRTVFSNKDQMDKGGALKKQFDQLERNQFYNEIETRIKNGYRGNEPFKVGQ